MTLTNDWRCSGRVGADGFTLGFQGVANCIEVPTNPQDLANAITPALETSNRNPADLDGENTYKILLAEDSEFRMPFDLAGLPWRTSQLEEGADTERRIGITDIVNQKVALKFLESAGHRVSVVENGALAVEAIKKHDYDVVLMDVSMPFMGGIEATSIIRKYEDSNSLERVPIIALTAHAMTGDREKW